jgi:hypothetical protein
VTLRAPANLRAESAQRGSREWQLVGRRFGDLYDLKWPTAAVHIVNTSTGPVDRDRQTAGLQDYTLSNVLTSSASLRNSLPSSITKSGAAKSRGPGCHGKLPKR